ncbi:hypothetical protein BH24ACT15_BH24ACT15_11900 [soil metagenome]
MPSLWADSLDEHRALVLDRLLNAYEDVRKDVGVDGVTLAAVTRQAGLARSAVYNYVGDKHGLILAHAERVMGRAVARLRTAVAQAPTPEDKLVAYVRLTLQLQNSETGAGDDLMSLLTPEEQQQLMAMLAPIRKVLEELVVEGVSVGVFDGDAQDLVAVVWATLGGFRMPVAAGHIAADHAAEIVSAVLLRGLTGGHVRGA